MYRDASRHIFTNQSRHQRPHACQGPAALTELKHGVRPNAYTQKTATMVATDRHSALSFRTTQHSEAEPGKNNRLGAFTFGHFDDRRDELLQEPVDLEQ